MAKEKSITELRDEKNQLVARSKEITTAAKTEKRMFNDGENEELSTIQTRMADINIEIAARESENSQQGTKHTENGGTFSLRSALLQLVDGGKFSEETQRMNDVGRRAIAAAGVNVRSSNGLVIPVEARSSFTATGESGTGSDLIDTEFLDILAPLRDRLVLAQAGATVLTGLRGNIDIPDFSGNTANWENENAAAQDGGGTFSHKSMKPKRLTSVIMVSRQLLIQDTLGVEQFLRSDMIYAIAHKLEATILGNAEHSETKPDGLFTGFAGSAIDLSWDSIVDLETSVDLANALADNSGYIMHTALRGKAKKTVKKTNGAIGFVLDPDGTMNGYNALRTNAIANVAATTGENPTPASYGIAFGNWADLIIGQWGALDLMVDPYTKADQAFVRIVINSYWDAIPRRAASFAKAMMK
ncbi:MAG: phage major capsid protein [Prevotella sp.]|jgi:HK97 family phage major capsid protein|nr:phage major capsid protein [Prevotella sp.]